MATKATTEIDGNKGIDFYFEKSLEKTYCFKFGAS
jgi:hypothetical protein